MRLTLVGKALILCVAVTAVVAVIAPTAGLVMAVALAVVGLVALSEGMGSSGAESGHDAWAATEAERKRETRNSGRYRP